MRERIDTQGTDDKDGIRERDSDATNKETLEDLEKNQGNIGSTGSDLDPGPSPDGAFDRSDEDKDAGPM
jgi:hypothetical protein